MSKNKKLLIRIIVSAAIYIVAIILNHFFELEEIVDLFKYNLFTVPKVITLVAFLASYLILAYSVICKSFSRSNWTNNFSFMSYFESV